MAVRECPADARGRAGNDLSDELRDALRFGPFPRALRLAISHRGLSLARLQAHLDQQGAHLGQSTLSYWQRGIRTPQLPASLETVGILEAVLGLPSGSLLTLLHRTSVEKPRNRASSRFTDLVPTALGGQADRLVAALKAPPESPNNTNLAALSVHDVITLDERRRLTRQSTRLVVAGSRADADRYVAVYTADAGCRVNDMAVVAAEGCRVGRVRRSNEDGGLAVELLFERTLAVGETHVFSYEVQDGTAAESPGWHRMFRECCPHYLLQLRFQREALPARCVREVRVRSGADAAPPRDLVCDTGGVSSAFFQNVGPGVAGASLEWS